MSYTMSGAYSINNRNEIVSESVMQTAYDGTDAQDVYLILVSYWKSGPLKPPRMASPVFIYRPVWRS